MLGTRMPSRPPYPDRETPFLTRIVEMLKDPRTWGTLLYFLLMLPLGIFYFSVRHRRHRRVGRHDRRADRRLFYDAGVITIDGDVQMQTLHPALLPLVSIMGIPAAHHHDASRAGNRLPAWPAWRSTFSYTRRSLLRRG